MYSTCIYCNQPLGANEVVEAFPVGRRLAFDQRRGRLWVVCRKCEKWNLSPFEERWEALEDCERCFRDARKRVSTDNIGLAKLDEGLELVRIGEPLRPEFAAWRYGDQFGHRRRRAILTGTALGIVGAAAMAGQFVGGALGMGAYAAWTVSRGLYDATRRRRVYAHVSLPSGQRVGLYEKDLESVLLVASPGESSGWGLTILDATLSGEYARHAVAVLMGRFNASGGSRREVQGAVGRLEQAGTPEHFMQALAKERSEVIPGRWKERRLGGLDLQTRLAIEMAVNEERERAALEGELALLELEWKEAEEIAGIADRLGLPADIDTRLERLRTEHTAEPRRPS